MKRVAWEDFVSNMIAKNRGNYDLHDLMEDSSDELYETGSYTVKFGNEEYVLELSAYRM